MRMRTKSEGEREAYRVTEIEKEKRDYRDTEGV
jgi:hypothetical protein